MNTSLREAFQNDQGFVPAYYLFDAEGKLRSFAAGERGLDMLKSAIDRVLPTESNPQLLRLNLASGEYSS